MDSYPRHIRTLLIWLGVPLVALAALNLLADPYGSFNLFPGSRLSRGASGRGTRIGKGEMIARHDWDVLLLGTSRVQLGLDPAHPALRGMRTYNAGLYGADYPEIDDAARAAIGRGTLKRLILCVDMYSFDPDRRPVPETQGSLLNPSINRVDYLLGNLLGYEATRHSFLTIANAWNHRDGNGYPLGLHQQAASELHGRHSDWILGGYYNLTIPPGAERSEQWSLSRRRLDALSQLLADATSAGVKVDLVQLPMHVVCLERYFAEDLWPVYERWLTTLTQIVDKHNRSFPASPIVLWDFCAYDLYDSDPAFEASQWFYDPFHFRISLGNLVLDRIMGNRAPTEANADAFGTILTRSNLSAHLADLRRGHAAYFAGSAEVRNMHASIRADLLRRRGAIREDDRPEGDAE